MGSATMLTGTVIGYFRSASENDSFIVPMQQLQAAGCSVIVHDVGTGAKTPLPNLTMALDTLTRGDTLVVTRLSDFGRSATHIVDVLQTLRDRGIRFVCLMPPLDFEVELGVADWVQHFADAAAMLRAERGQKMRESAQQNGKRVGRPKKITRQVIAKAQGLLAKGHKVHEIAQILGVSQSGLYEALNSERQNFQQRQQTGEIG